MKSINNFIRRVIFKIIFKNIYIYKFGILAARYTNFLLPHEEDMHGLTHLKLEKSKIIVDVGASDGLYYKSIRHLGIKNKLYAFEPLKENIRYLNKISRKDKKFKYARLALGNRSSNLSIYTPHYEGKYINNFSSFSKNECKKNFKINNFNINLKNLKFKKSSIKQKTLDSYKFKTALIKIDVEGYEKNVLLGAMNTIKRFKPIIYVENNKGKSDTINFFKKKLTRLKYKPYLFNCDNKSFVKYSKKEAGKKSFSYNVYFMVGIKINYRKK
tara:strand:- start:2563 stop:3375 length:813 start_codon:yes stop_codon:yes gene_type:complete